MSDHLNPSPHLQPEFGFGGLAVSVMQKAPPGGDGTEHSTGNRPLREQRLEAAIMIAETKGQARGSDLSGQVAQLVFDRW